MIANPGFRPTIANGRQLWATRRVARDSPIVGISDAVWGA
jgi:hypothetical protein